MVRGLGTDIIEISRIRSSIEKHQQHFLDRIFTKNEQDYCLKHAEPAGRFAGHFAAKEAIVKAFGIGFRDGISWHDFEISHDDKGKPFVILSEKVRESVTHDAEVIISISHCREYAVATAILI